MHVTMKEMRSVGLRCTVKMHGKEVESVSIRGSEPMSDETHEHLHRASTLLELSPQDEDRLRDYAADLTVWTMLRHVSR